MAPGKQRQKAAMVTEDKFASLVRRFMSPANPKWHLPPPAGYAHMTKETWRRALDFSARAECLGDVSVQEIRPSLVQKFFDAIANRPGKQAVTLAALRQLERWAIVREMLPRQITLGVEIGHSSGGHTPWTDEQVALGEAHARPDIARAITLGANTGQRGSDLVRLGPNDIEVFRGKEGIKVIQQKTKREVWIPILSTLAAAMATWERVPGPYLRQPDGRPWKRIGLSNAWDREKERNPALAPLKAAGLVIHGLRGHACVRLYRAGATTKQVADMVGMSEEMVKNYTRLSDQRENATAAVIHLERTILERNIAMSSKAR